MLSLDKYAWHLMSFPKRLGTSVSLQLLMLTLSVSDSTKLEVYANQLSLTAVL